MDGAFSRRAAFKAEPLGPQADNEVAPKTHNCAKRL
jgi:hypothetical protein